MANVSKAAIKEAIAKKLKSDEAKISVFGLKTKFGGGRTSGFALIYNSEEYRKKFDMKSLLKRVSFQVFTPARLTNGDCLMLACPVDFDSMQFITNRLIGWPSRQESNWT